MIPFLLFTQYSTRPRSLNSLFNDGRKRMSKLNKFQWLILWYNEEGNKISRKYLLFSRAKICFEEKTLYLKT
jgi:hypothetical protein